jgi:rhamnosyltransferase
MPDVTPRNIAAVVVLYRPDASALDNIAAYARQVDRVFAVDNTETPDPAFVARLAGFENLEYVPLGDNLGIATALNVGVERARDSGHAWALTMDQDSTATPDMVERLTHCAGSCDIPLPIGIISPVQADEGGPEFTAVLACRLALTVITSGDLLNVEAWEKVGRFDDGLFIDQVDHDMCLKMRADGYAVIRCGAARMLHRVGALKEYRFPRHAYTTNHSPLRRYYITRNRFIVGTRYGAQFPEFRKREMRALRRELAKVVLYEDRKTAKLLMSWRGYRDFRRGVTGPYSGR